MFHQDKEHERQKYELMWERHEYRRHSPGEHLVDQAVTVLGLRLGVRVLDLGCGTGRAAARLHSYGIDVIAVDHAANCMDPGVQVPFVQACLWELPNGLSAPYGFCVDVLEHIPPHRVAQTLLCMRDRVETLFFQVSCVPDRMGALIDDTLHLTVQNAVWWAGTIWEHFGAVHVLSSGPRQLVGVARRNI